MSLLLDALKKAADDKQRIAQDRLAEEPLDMEASEEGSELSLQAGDGGVQNSEPEEELTLDLIDKDITESPSNMAEPGTADENLDDGSLQLQQPDDPGSRQQKTYTVSDEALSMLIYKTNRDVKQGKRLAIASVMIFSLAVLTLGAVYYYMDMQSEIANLERKHQIAMQSMQSKTNREKAPQQSEIIRNLVSESDLEDKVRYAKKQMTEKPAQKQAVQSQSVASRNSRNEAGVVSFQKTNKTDPIAERLEQAWQAYDDGRYDSAKSLYAEVLRSEQNNRDALLGLGAIAVIEKDYLSARKIYISLLKQDPRDPIAIAAIASMQSDAASLQEEALFLQNMLQKNPDAAPLNFALGNVYAQQQKWKPAQQSYFNAWQQDIENADYIFNLAVSLDQLGKQEQAISFYRDSLVKSSNKQVSFSREAVQKRITELSGL
ncbi:MAG: tetratricopeptide repeat protein [Gammaproteobacteria bacterium]|nr:tetratricopeptide repeat protein [Gammaproteobacteria bacterium]MBT8133425.1 tetratricopeptide repeat protein [Gammaproteobacteria bacterium]NNJ49377.1 tetratricopeptide repeat protein [Gammaproteobacteria bacterium]